MASVTKTFQISNFRSQNGRDRGRRFNIASLHCRVVLTQRREDAKDAKSGHQFTLEVLWLFAFLLVFQFKSEIRDLRFEILGVFCIRDQSPTGVLHIQDLRVRNAVAELGVLVELPDDFLRLRIEFHEQRLAFTRVTVADDVVAVG